MVEYQPSPSPTSAPRNELPMPRRWRRPVYLSRDTTQRRIFATWDADSRAQDRRLFLVAPKEFCTREFDQQEDEFEDHIGERAGMECFVGRVSHHVVVVAWFVEACRVINEFVLMRMAGRSWKVQSNGNKFLYLVLISAISLHKKDVAKKRKKRKKAYRTERKQVKYL